MKTLYRLCFITEEADAGAVLRRLLAVAKAVSVVAPRDHDVSAPSRYALAATFDRLPTAGEIAAIRRVGGALTEGDAAALEAARPAPPDVEATLDRLLEAGEVKRAALKRARRAT